MPAPSLPTIKRSFALSENRCAFPDCNVPIVEESDTVTGEICHIKAASPGGARFDEEQSDGDRHAYGNLILLCARHHKIVDSDPNKYKTETLVGLKRRGSELGVADISPATAKAAQSLLDNYHSVVIHSNTGQIAIQSPGTIQAGIVNLKATKASVTVSPTVGSIAESRIMLSYAKYLISRYQEYQKAALDKEGA